MDNPHRRVTSTDVGDAPEDSLKSLALICIVKTHDTSAVAFTKLFSFFNQSRRTNQLGDRMIYGEGKRRRRKTVLMQPDHQMATIFPQSTRVFPVTVVIPSSYLFLR